MQFTLEEKGKGSNICVEFCAGLLVYLPFTISFGILTHDESYYAPCSESSSTYQWSHVTFIFLCIGTCFCLFVSPLLRLLLAKLKDSSLCCITILAPLLTIILLGLGVFSLVCFGGLCHAYGENENCGQLNNLVLAYIIFLSVGLGLGLVGGCIGICVTICFGGMMLSAKKQEEMLAAIQEASAAQSATANKGKNLDVEKQQNQT